MKRQSPQDGRTGEIVANRYLKSRSMLCTSCVASTALFSITSGISASMYEGACEDHLIAVTHGATVTLHVSVQRSCFCEDLRTT